MWRIWLLLLSVGCAHGSGGSPAERADAAHRDGRLADAYEAYAEAVCAEPARLPLARRLVETWAELGRAGTPLVRIEACNVAAGTRAYIEGLVAGARGDIDAADRAFARAEGELEERAEVVYRRGVVALNGGRAADALGHLERAAGLDASRVDVRLAMAQALVELGRAPEAVAALGGLMALEPNRAEIERARRILGGAVRANEPAMPEGIESVLRDILSALEKGDSPPDVLARAQGLAAEVSHPRVLKVAGLVLLHRGLEAEARDRLLVAAEANPLDAEPWRVIGAAAFAADRVNEALAPLREAWQRDPFDVEVARMLARVAAAGGEDTLARDAYRALTVLEPGVADHRLWLARSERKLGRLEIARRAAERGSRLQPDHIPLLVELASIEAQLTLSAPTEGERERARERTHAAVERLLEVAPEHPGAAAILNSIEPKT
jgi:tetratricopeptide (TPR) repeat protein